MLNKIQISKAEKKNHLFWKKTSRHKKTRHFLIISFTSIPAQATLYSSLELESDRVLVSLKVNLILHNLFYKAMHFVVLIGRLNAEISGLGFVFCSFTPAEFFTGFHVDLKNRHEDLKESHRSINIWRTLPVSCSCMNHYKNTDLHSSHYS